jgi:iron-sulfur cluster protein
MTSKLDNRPDFLSVSEGCTRDCFYPWDTIFIHADRSVRVCCASPIIDHVPADWDLEALANGANFRTFRQISLRVNWFLECQQCTIKPEIPIENFIEKLTQHLQEKGDPRTISQVDRPDGESRTDALGALGDVRKGDICALPFSDSIFDLVFATDIIDLGGIALTSPLMAAAPRRVRRAASHQAFARASVLALTACALWAGT